jgi:hypothetical protein
MILNFNWLELVMQNYQTYICQHMSQLTHIAQHKLFNQGFQRGCATYGPFDLQKVSMGQNMTDF